MDHAVFEFLPFEPGGEYPPEAESPAWETEKRRGRGASRSGSKPRRNASRLSSKAMVRSTARSRPRPPSRNTQRPRSRLGAPAAPCVCPAHGTEYVRWVQSALNQVASTNLTVTGVMTATTRNALRRFQSSKGLPVDGIAGPDVEQALRDARQPADSGAPTEALAPDQGEVYEFETLALEAPTSRPTLRLGSRGSAVADLQRRLGAAGFSAGAADGIFGANTGAAVRAFQRARGLGTDGVAGSMTWGALLGGMPSGPGVPSGGGARFGPVPEVNTLLPKTGTGFVGVKSESRRFGLSETIEALKQVGQRWQSRYPSGPLVQISDISQQGGGALKPHSSHRMGIDVDIRFIRNDGNLGSVNPLIRSEAPFFDRARTQDLVNMIRANGVLKVHKLWVNQRIGLSGIDGDNIHNNHMHVRFCVPSRLNLSQTKKAAKISPKGTYSSC
jgi:peptidoglycan hydrolase-like protein with peptidoglycan-binding domain